MATSPQYQCVRASMYITELNVVSRCTFELHNKHIGMFVRIHACVENDHTTTFDCILYNREWDGAAGKYNDTRMDGELFTDAAYMNLFLRERAIPPFSSMNAEPVRIPPSKVELIKAPNAEHMVYSRDGVYAIPQKLGANAISVSIYSLFDIVDATVGSSTQYEFS